MINVKYENSKKNFSKIPYKIKKRYLTAKNISNLYQKIKNDENIINDEKNINKIEDNNKIDLLKNSKTIRTNSTDDYNLNNKKIFDDKIFQEKLNNPLNFCNPQTNIITNNKIKPEISKIKNDKLFRNSEVNMQNKLDIEKNNNENLKGKIKNKNNGEKIDIFIPEVTIEENIKNNNDKNKKYKYTLKNGEVYIPAVINKKKESLNETYNYNKTNKIYDAKINKKTAGMNNFKNIEIYIPDVEIDKNNSKKQKNISTPIRKDLFKNIISCNIYDEIPF